MRVRRVEVLKEYKVSNQMIGIARFSVTMAWLFGAACFFYPLYDSGIGDVGRILFWVLLATHAVECLIFLPTLRKTDQPLIKELAATLIFGVIHFGQVKQALLEKESS